MFRPRVAVDEDVVEENQNKAAEEGPEYLVHKRLECRRCVRQAERHHQELVESFMGAERRLMHIIWVHPHLMIAGTEVKLGEEACAAEFIEKFIRHRDRELIFHRLGVQLTVVHAKAP